jgi:integrase
MLNDAWERGLNKNDAYKSKRLMVPKRQADNIYLSEDELQRLEELNLTGETTLQRVRDLFLIAAYTGLRYADFVNLHPGNIIDEGGQLILEVNTQKTDEKVFIPVHPVVKRIMDKYGGPPAGISNQKLNEYIKVICKGAEISEPVIKRTYRGGERQEEHFEKWELVSSHTGRRSFATNAYKAGLDPISIMKITGHKTPEMFMKYIKVDKKENAVRMAGHAFFSS